MANERPLGPGKITIDDQRLSTVTFEYDDERFTLRELSVDEGDDIFDAAQTPVDPKNPNGPMRFNGRFNSRSLLAASMVEPTATVDQIGKWGGKKYVTFMQYYEGLNTIPEANPTGAAGSAAPTSPAGGEPTPTN